ncbi:glycosyltransferase [Lysobacter korlensis]|uniref:Glycosyltransferase n=1 Tax=Lysobacter korlensis TaxID=553636 RepID=A0ABV6RYI9_9GAMM
MSEADPPSFSLLLPYYRRDDPAFFLRAFRSTVTDQTLKPAQVVLVQDGEVPDALATVVDESAAGSPVPVDIVRLPTNRGLATALEEGLRACRFEVVARMDADDISLPHRFERQLPMLASGLDLVGAGMLEFEDEVGKVVGRRVPPVGQESIAKYARFHDPFNHPTVVYRKQAVAAAGGYRDLGLMEDYYLFARMIHSGAKVGNVAEPLVMYRVSSGAYARRGGLNQLKAELMLQRAFRRSRFTTRSQFARNIAVRGGYRLVPETLRRVAYRSLIARPPRTDQGR